MKYTMKKEFLLMKDAKDEKILTGQIHLSGFLLVLFFIGSSGIGNNYFHN